MACLAGNGPASKANAHLIAEAPHLYAALMEVVERLDWDERFETYDAWRARMRRYAALLARAGGES